MDEHVSSQPSTAPWMHRLLGDREAGAPPPADLGPPPWQPHLPRPEARDAVAAISVALVLIPQALAYAVIAGMPPVVGLTVGATATIAAAPFVSSPWLQTGPVAITALLTFGGLAGLAQPGTGEYVKLGALLALLVGIIRVVVGITRTGPLAYIMSRPVLDGFTPAAAIVIVLGQLPTILGVESSARGPAALVPVLSEPTQWNWEAVVVAVLAAGVVFAAGRIHPLVPGVLLAVIVAIVVTVGFDLQVAVLGAIPNGLPRLVLSLPFSHLTSLLVPAVIIALVGFAEPAAIARTFANETRTRWDPDREFVSQGVGNLASGLFGGYPVGGSFSRSAIARAAGGATPWVGLMTGLLVLAAMPAVGLLYHLPEAALAGVIVAAVSGMVKLRPILVLREFSRQQFVVAVSTFVATILFAPQIQYGLLVGVVMSVGGHLRRELVVQLPNWMEDDALHVRPLGVLYFGSAPLLGDHITQLLRDRPEVRDVVLHMDRIGRVDVTGAMALESLSERLGEADITVTVDGLTPMGNRIVGRVLGSGHTETDLHDLGDPATR